MPDLMEPPAREKFHFPGLYTNEPKSAAPATPKKSSAHHDTPTLPPASGIGHGAGPAPKKKPARKCI